MKKTLSKTRIKAIAFSLLFLVSGIGSSVLISPAAGAPNTSPTPSPMAALSQAEANWAAPNGNSLNQDYNPQNQINSSNAQNLGLNWLFPLPTRPTALTSYVGAGGLGVATAPMIINGTIYALTQFGEIFALSATNGNVIWSDTLPILPNSTAGIAGIAGIALHLHDGAEQYTTKLFGGTPTLWYAAPGLKIWAINAINGHYELNFTYFTGTNMVQGNSPTALESPIAPNILIDQNRGIAITSIGSGSSPATGRCFYRGWNILVNPPTPLWTTYCTPPQPGGNLPVDPNWTVNQVNSMKGAEIFYPGPSANGGGYIPGSSAVVNLKTLSTTQLNATLYNDWGYVGQSAQCSAYTGGSSTGSTAAGWGAAWLLGTGPTSGLAFVNTNNKDPYTSPCTPGPDLWSASLLAINETTGQWVWGFQANAHELWDYDCSWWQALGNETINGATTQVIWKTCKNGYLYELNAQTGNLIWAWTPPASIMPRCQYCYMYNPLNSTQMNYAFFNPSLQPALMYPSELAGFENEASYSPTLNYLFLASQNVPGLAYYVAPNGTNYKTNSGIAFYAPAGGPLLGGKGVNGANNATIEAVDASTGQMVWTHFVPLQGYRGGVTTSGNVVFVTLSSGDLLMLNAQNGNLIRDYFIGGPLNVLPSIGATAGGTEEVVFPITAGLVSWATGIPGDLVALSLQNVQSASTNTITTTVAGAGATITTTVAGAGATITTTVAGAGGATITTTINGVPTTITQIQSGTSSGVDTTTFYGVAAVAAIFIIATGYLAMRGRKPAS